MRANSNALRLAASVFAAGLTLAVASPAAGQPPTVAPPGNPAVSQYLELVPTVSGAKPSDNVHGSHAGSLATGGFGGGPGGGGVLSHSTVNRLDAHGPLGALTASIALATAPARHGHVGGSVRSSPAGAVTSPSSAVLSAVAGSSGDGGLGVLLPALLAAIVIGGGALALVRRKAKPPAP
ncbi:MAG TPA: hypothetical protein VKR21_07460 [Solirubrobacteraceae bacterium]|nr:hypothetical protein [Solirubrobacteraceae bacterium]